MTRLRGAAVWVLLGALALAATTGRALADDGDEAKRLFQQGQKFYNLGDFTRAIADYKRAYELSEKPALLFNIAQAYRLSGDFKQALFFYQSFQRAQPDAPNRAEVLKRIGEMEHAVAQQEAAKQPPNGTVSPDGTPAVVTTTTTTTTTVPVAAPADPATRVPSPGETAAHSSAGTEQQTPPSQAPPAPGERSRPLYKKWWFWAGVGAVAAGATVAIVVASGGGGAEGPSTHFPTQDL